MHGLLFQLFMIQTWFKRLFMVSMQWFESSRGTPNTTNTSLIFSIETPFAPRHSHLSNAHEMKPSLPANLMTWQGPWMGWGKPRLPFFLPTKTTNITLLDKNVWIKPQNLQWTMYALILFQIPIEGSIATSPAPPFEGAKKPCRPFPATWLAWNTGSHKLVPSKRF